MSATDPDSGRATGVVLYADTSFLISLFVKDSNTTQARAELASLGSPLGVSPLGRLEFRTAILQRVGRGDLELTAAARVFLSLERLFEEGYFVDLQEDPGKTWEEAHRVSDRQTASLALRSLDIWHLGFALVSGATKVCTFDERMRRGAKAEGMGVVPGK